MSKTLVALNTSPSFTGVSLNTSPSSTLVSLNTSPSFTSVSLPSSISWLVKGFWQSYTTRNWEDSSQLWSEAG
jgi:hypothetical protein